jgi:hypothetical protein
MRNSLPATKTRQVPVLLQPRRNFFRWDRPSFFVVCQAFAKPQEPDRRQRTIVCPTWFPAPIPLQLGRYEKQGQPSTWFLGVTAHDGN